MFRPHRGIAQTHADRMTFRNLASAILNDVRLDPVNNSRSPPAKRSTMVPRVNPCETEGFRYSRLLSRLKAASTNLLRPLQRL
jgi:hypothetical protein